MVRFIFTQNNYLFRIIKNNIMYRVEIRILNYDQPFKFPNGNLWYHFVRNDGGTAMYQSALTNKIFYCHYRKDVLVERHPWE